MVDPVAQQAYAKLRVIGTSQTVDFLGQSVAVDGDTVVVGAPFEDSATTLVVLLFAAPRVVEFGNKKISIQRFCFRWIWQNVTGPLPAVWVSD